MEKLIVYGGTAIIGIVMIAFYIVIAFAPVWVVGSVLTSGIKAGTKQCGQTYPIEKVLGGNWFCPKN
jgi:hypothetical protein